MIKVLFWSNIGLMLFMYFIYPIAIFIIARIMGKEPQKEEITPFLSLIIPMHNEEQVARQKIENILSLEYPKEQLEIIFALDNCTDKTQEIISQYRDQRIKIFDSKERLGKVAAMNEAVPLARGEIIIFSDANSMNQTDTIKKIVRNFADKSVGCVSGRLCYIDADTNAIGKGENLYWKYETFIKNQESRLGKLLITNGSIQAIRKELYPYPDPEIADDFSIPLLVQAKGYKVLYEPEAIVSELATQNIKEEFQQKVRIVSQGLKGAIKLRKDLLKLSPLGLFELMFHKVLRWFGPFFMLTIFLSNLALIRQLLYFYLFLAQAIFYLFSLIGFLLRNSSRINFFYIPFYFNMINFASLAACYHFLKSGETRIWDKADSTRANKNKELHLESHA
ncbi:MAG: glycosyltransferase family 2 protein [Candidatus Omnitrophota bacterium]